MNNMPCHISDGPAEDDRYVWDELPNIAAGFDRTPWHATEKETEMTEDRPSVPMNDNMTLDQAVPSKSKYLTKDDCEPPLLVQIFQMTTDQVEADNVIEERAVLHFHGDIKPMILNNTNKELLKHITGATTVGGVKNHQIILYNDPTIMFGRKMVGGIRIRSPQAPPQPQAYPAATPPIVPTAEATQPGTGSQDFDPDSIPY